MDGIAKKSIEVEAERAVVIDRWLRGTKRITLFEIAPTGLKPVPPIMLIGRVRLRREFKKKTRFRSSAIIVDPKDSSELERIADCLSRFFDLPVLCEEEVARKHGGSMHLSFDSSRHPQIAFILPRERVEIGPRITLSKLVWEVS